MLSSTQHNKDSFVLNRGGAPARTAPTGMQLPHPRHAEYSSRSSERFFGQRPQNDRGSGEGFFGQKSQNDRGGHRRNTTTRNGFGAKPFPTQRPEETLVIHLVRGHDILAHPLKKGAQITVLIIALFLTISIGSTLAYFTAQDDKVHSVPLETIELSLDEIWNPADGIDYNAGLTTIKSPTITADAGSMYTRICMKVEENVPDSMGGTTTQLITDPNRLALIEGIFYADPGNLLQIDTPYSRSEIAAYPGVYRLCDPAHFLQSSSAQRGLYYFEYNGIMTKDQEATLFNKVVIPSDYSREDLALMGTFRVSFEGQGIQSFGFMSQADAMAELNRVVNTP